MPAMILRIPRLNSKKVQYGMLLLVIKTVCSMSEVVPYNDAVDTVIAIFITGLFGLRILESKYSVGVLSVYFLIGIMGLYTCTQVGNVSIFISILTIMAIRDEDINKVIQCLFAYELIVGVINVAAALVLVPIFDIQLTFSIRGVERYGLGFSNPNTFSVYLFNLIIMWCWINFERLRKEHLLIIAGIELIAYGFTRTRTSLLDAAILLVLLIFAIMDSPVNRLVKFGAKYITIFLALATWISTALYKKYTGIMMLVDQMLTGRVRIGAYITEKYGYTLFGQRINERTAVWDEVYGLNTFNFDNVYTYFLSCMGIVWLVLICFLFYRLAQRKDLKTCVFIIIWAFYGIAEMHGVNGYLCFPILLVSTLLNGRGEGLKKRRG